MQDFVVEYKAKPSASFRCTKAANSLDIDVSKKLTHRISISGIDIKDSDKIGMIVGASGTGKTSFAKEFFDFNENSLNVDYTKPIIDQFPETFSYEDCARLLSGCGLNSVPCWIKPLGLLSNGQKSRALCALEIASDRKIKVIDEFTSVVDRNVAKAMATGIVNYIAKNQLKVVLISCHYDIVEWINPDFIIDTNEEKFIRCEKKNGAKSLNFTSSNLNPENHGKGFASIII